ncbi:ThiF family adenylyltransferase [Caulobacter sp. RL271]|uniref:ThiF family adenylyltransferase n=1 Tax=Caulobacter segnis TaxID=88688 RepID=A0ABY4ZT60_9CAUL|nr:ThiF family adenylyltransferase [Caulobacter segnis]USQ95898.1 ThiF family adenylyltransferase [Caulobacter segnis]
MNAIVHDRSAQLLMAVDGLGYDEARFRLERAALVIDGPPDLDEAHQALLLSVVRCGVRMFKAGVFLGEGLSGRITIGLERPARLRRALQDLGAQVQTAPLDAARLWIGADDGHGAPQLRAWVDGWQAVISPRPAEDPPRTGNVLAGMAAGGLAVAELFRKTVLADVRACRRPQALSVWGANEPEIAKITRLPRHAWLLGLGNLGQATLFGLSLLPWDDPGEATFVLNDADVVGPENLSVQILTTPAWIGRKKVRAAAEWIEARGFKVVLDERRFIASTQPGQNDPRMALVGVDNLDARRWAAASGFDLVIDAGLGASGPEAFDIRLHAFPGAQDPAAVWPEIQTAGRKLPSSLAALVEQGRLDMCGAMTIAGASVGVPCTAVVAAALQLGQACRALETGSCADRVDLSLADLPRASWRQMPAALYRGPAVLASRVA